MISDPTAYWAMQAKANNAAQAAAREAIDRLRDALIDDGILEDEAHIFAERHGPAIVAALRDIASPPADYTPES